MRDDSLSSVLTDFARTLVTNFPIQAILDHLVVRIVDVLPVTGAGVTLMSADSAPHYVAASDRTAMRFERLQTGLGHGPCVMAYEMGESVAVPELATDERFTQFATPAVAAGMAAVFAFPLRHDNQPLGALDLYRDVPGMLDAQDMRSAQTLADVASAYILNARARQEALDVTERFRDSALHDALTGLPNRALLDQRLKHAALRAQRSHTTAAVLFIDLDRFKTVNDTYGHATGDALLIAVAERLSAAIRPGDTLARASGDEFVILYEDLGRPQHAETLAARIVEAFTKPYVVEGSTIWVTASVGVAYAGPGESITHQLISDADTAMYKAKRRGGAGHHVIDLREAHEAHRRNGLERDLRSALAGTGLDVAYQPIVRSKDGVMIGVEAFLRWTHPERGAISPITAIDIAEQSGLIADLGAWVMLRACQDHAKWAAASPERPLHLSVNVSVRQLMSPGLLEMVTAVLQTTEIDPTLLVLEVTEGIFIADQERAMTVLASLKNLGVRIALDDFGTGYCSLNYLRRFPVDILKVDQSFVVDIAHNGVGRAVVSLVTDLAHVLGITVTAEGIETEDQRRHVQAIGCEAAQGYLFARPMDQTDITAHLTRRPGQPVRLPTIRAIRDPRAARVT